MDSTNLRMQAGCIDCAESDERLAGLMQKHVWPLVDKVRKRVYALAGTSVLVCSAVPLQVHAVQRLDVAMNQCHMANDCRYVQLHVPSYKGRCVSSFVAVIRA
jgi:hypothetical protein